MSIIALENSAQLAALIGIMRNRLRITPAAGQSLREVRREGIRFTLGVARTGHISMNYGLESPSRAMAMAWRAEADKLNIGPVE